MTKLADKMKPKPRDVNYTTKREKYTPASTVTPMILLATLNMEPGHYKLVIQCWIILIIE